MLGLRFFACTDCETVFAGPEAPPTCGRCGADGLDELTRDLQGAGYFEPPTDARS